MRKFLTKHERLSLQNRHQSESNKRHADRIKTILLLDEGYTYEKVSKILLLNEKSCRRYYQSYQAGGLEHLLEDHYEGGSSKLSETQAQELKKHLSENLYYTAQEVVDDVKKTYKY